MSDDKLTNAVPDPDLSQEDEQLEEEVDDDFEPGALEDVLPQAEPTDAGGQLP